MTREELIAFKENIEWLIWQTDVYLKEDNAIEKMSIWEFNVIINIIKKRRQKLITSALEREKDK